MNLVNDATTSCPRLATSRMKSPGRVVGAAMVEIFVLSGFKVSTIATSNNGVEMILKARRTPK